MKFSRALRKLFQEAYLIIFENFDLFSFDVWQNSIEKSKCILLSWRNFNGWNKSAGIIRKSILRCLGKLTQTALNLVLGISQDDPVICSSDY